MWFLFIKNYYLSKAFELLVVKLHAHGLSFPALKMIQDYLLYWKQRVKTGSSYSTFENNISGVPQGLILEPLLFNIFLLEHENCCYAYYADDTTPYVVANNTAEVLENLTNITQRFSTWFANNQMKANHGKCQL